MRLDYELDVTTRSALCAGSALRSFTPGNVQIGQSVMSAAMVSTPDLIADDIIISCLRLAFPHDTVCSEQAPVSCDRFESDRLWLVDALDGNTNLVEHGDKHAVSVGLMVRGQAVLGVVNPMRDELFTGAEGHPTTLNGFPAQACRAGKLSDTRIGVPRSEWAYSSILLQLPLRTPISKSHLI